MNRIWLIWAICFLLVAGKGCKEGDSKNKAKAIEAAENVIHYRNVLGIRDICMRVDVFDSWGDPDIESAYEGTKYDVAVLDPEPCNEPEVHHVPDGWAEMPCEAVFYEELSGAELGRSLAKLIERGEDEGSWGKVEVVAGHPLTDDTILDSSWVVPFVFVHDQMVAPLAGSGAIFRIDVILDKELKLISVITTGGQTWIS